MLGRTSSEVDCTFSWGEKGFTCLIIPVTNTATITPNVAVPAMADSPPPPPTHVGRACTPQQIPTSQDGHIITQAWFKLFRGNPICLVTLQQHGMTAFRIAARLCEKLQMIAKTRSADKTLEATAFSLDFLTGCRLIKEGNAKIRVKGQNQDEYAMWIVDTSGKMLVNQEKPNFKRKQGQDEDRRRDHADEEREAIGYSENDAGNAAGSSSKRHKSA